jgi:hypothetical protein
MILFSVVQDLLMFCKIKRIGRSNNHIDLKVGKEIHTYASSSQRPALTLAYARVKGNLANNSFDRFVEEDL